MKACVLTEKEHIEYKEVPMPELKNGEVLLKIRACGICSSDFNRVYKDSAYFFPIILGHEFAGEIVKCADDVDASYIGKKAAVFPLLPCNECDFCKSKHYAQCKNYSYFGSRQNGAMAEYIAVPIWNIVFLPDDMDFAVGSMCEPAAVGVHAVNKIKDIKGKSLCISGSGTIGILSGLYAKSVGVDVSFVLRNSKKIEFLQSLGFEKFIIGEENNSEFDVVIECVGSNESISNSINLVKSRGTVILVGNPASDIEFNKKLYWKILRSELKILGVWNSLYKGENSDDWQVAVEFLYKYQDTLKNLITDYFKLSDGIKAFETMKNNTRITLKGVFENE